MSSSIAIPAGHSSTMKYDDHHHHHRSKAPVSSSSSTYSASPRTPAQSASGKSPATSVEKQKVMMHQRRPSLLSSAISKQECTFIEVGDKENPRLISYLSSGQGFTWNPEIFLPSYIDYDYTPLENKREPVIDIVLTDEEIKNMLPK